MKTLNTTLYYTFKQLVLFKTTTVIRVIVVEYFKTFIEDGANITNSIDDAVQ